MTGADYADSPGWSLTPRAKLEILFATLLALFLFALDQTVVGGALPVIITELGGNELYTCRRAMSAWRRPTLVSFSRSVELSGSRSPERSSPRG